MNRSGYRVADEGELDVTCVADVYAVLGEGPVWVSRDETLYWFVIKGRKIFRLGERGEVEQWETPLRVGSLAPRAGGGFIAGTEPGIAEIDRYSPAGECLRTMELPIAKPTSCAFGGRDLDRLYITSASIGLGEAAQSAQPQAGGLFMASSRVRGVAELPFAG